ncbi:uncharacterized protein EI90DRAFT_202338 [Cantharellus anzutake]|uniref:uncharacterized protein n=1 Tax=Cantharellus anzutake TaxID=1750568 RepID=UPI001904ED5D|nr:uncharacterized protein EI90DRAFT_202338 [Cantharellus anzutake]KAF8336620.1 hypothetical protein EI90DRAFT_202338 [Cantharellus anzutake]
MHVHNRLTRGPTLEWSRMKHSNLDTTRSLASAAMPNPPIPPSSRILPCYCLLCITLALQTRDSPHTPSAGTAQLPARSKVLRESA